MKLGANRHLLQQGLDDLAQARRHLDFSFRRVVRLTKDDGQLSEEQLEKVEAFCSRFARVIDLLVNKVLRSLDRMELMASGTLLDVVNRAEKRGLVDHAADLREMKEVRNMIAHDYAGANSVEIFAFWPEAEASLRSKME